MRTILAILALAAVAQAGDPPRIAVWDPGRDAVSPRVNIDAAWLARVAAWLGEAGLPTGRLDTQAIDAGSLQPGAWPVLVMPGDSVPRAIIPELCAYAQGGGILVGLAARVPFNDAIAPGAKEAWRVDPEQPRFAWETRQPRETLGIRYAYKPELHDQGVLHRPSALWLRYLPDAPEVRRRLPHAWLFSIGEGAAATRFIPLVDSLREDAVSVVPAIYIARSGPCTALLCTQGGWTGRERAPWWPRQRETVQALGRLALDLAHGSVDLAAEPAVALVADPPPPAPGSIGPGVDPDGAVPLARFGAFDGSTRGMAEPVAAGTELRPAAGSAVPRGLEPGARLVLTLPAAPADVPRWLRLRLTFSGSDAGIAAAIGGRSLLSELFVWHDLTGAGNNQVQTASPVDVNRIVCIPPGVAGELVLSNPGTKPVLFDAVQVETRPVDPPAVLVGFNASMGMTWPGGKHVLPEGVGRGWGAVRQTLRLQLLGEPGDPRRWEQVDAVLAQAHATGAPVHAILEGCPRWLAKPDTYEEAVRRKRPHICVPRPDAWAAMLEELVPRYRDRVAAWELWNEVDIAQFWIGTPEEYVELWQATLPVLRRLDPGKPVFSGGLAAQKRETIEAMIDGGVAGEATWFANHCYAGQTPMWEEKNGRVESMLFARGITTPIHANEQGFVFANAEWFTGPPAWTRERQAAATDIAIARLMAAGHVRVSVFTCGGDGHPYGYLDERGGETPAYRAVMDYMALNGPGARREDVLLLAQDGAPLRGTYAAAARHADGTQVVVLNPSEAGGGRRRVLLGLHLPDARPRGAVVRGPDGEAALPLRQDGAWAEAEIDLAGRTVLRLAP